MKKSEKHQKTNPKSGNRSDSSPMMKSEGFKVGASIATPEGISTSSGPAVIESAPVASPIDAIEAQFKADADEAARPKRKYTKRAKPEETESISGEKVQAFADAGKLLLRFISTRLPNPIPPSPEEETLFADALGAVIVKYLPTAGEYAAEATLAIVSAGIFLPRLVKDKPEDKPE